MKDADVMKGFEQGMMKLDETTPNITVVGGPETFRAEVARAVGTAPENIEWIADAPAAEEAIALNPTWSDVIVLGPRLADMDALGLAEIVTRARPTAAMVLVRDGELNGLLPTAMRAGIRDFVDLSTGGNDLGEALQRAMSWSESVRSLKDKDRKRTRLGTVIAVFSSKGGVGKTFVATNVAAALAARSGEDTALVDLDFGMGDVFSYYGTEPNRPLQDVVGLNAERDADAIIAAATPLGSHLYGYASPNDVTQEGPSGDDTAATLRALQKTFSYVVIDTPANYSDHVLAAFDVADEICLVAGLDIVGIKHLSKAIETLVSIGVPQHKLRVVLNRADSKVGLEPQDVERIMNIDIKSMIPSSRLVPTSLNKGRLLYTDDPKSEVSKSVATLADNYVRIVRTKGDGAKRRFFKRG